MSFKEYSHNPVLTCGSEGEWDAGALGTMSIVRVGKLFHMFYEAWGSRSHANWSRQEYDSLQIGHAISVCRSTMAD